MTLAVIALWVLEQRWCALKSVVHHLGVKGTITTYTDAERSELSHRKETHRGRARHGEPDQRRQDRQRIP